MAMPAGLTVASFRPGAIGTLEARRLAEVARAVGLGDSPDDALQLHNDALAMLGADQETPLVADLLRWQGSVLRQRSRITDAEPLYERSLRLAVRLGYDSGRAHALSCLAAIAQRRGDVTGAAGLLTDALALAAQCDDVRLIGILQQNLGIIADIRGNPAAALAHYRVSLRTFENAKDEQSMCWVLSNLGYLHIKEGRYDEAAEALDRALAIARDRGDLMSEGTIEENRGELALMTLDLRAAERSILRALNIARQRGDDARRAAALKLHGARQRLSGAPELAIKSLERAEKLSAMGEDTLLGAEVLYQLGLALRDADRFDEGNAALSRALDGFEQNSARQWVGRTRRQLTIPTSGRYL